MLGVRSNDPGHLCVHAVNVVIPIGKQMPFFVHYVPNPVFGGLLYVVGLWPATKGGRTAFLLRPALRCTPLAGDLKRGGRRSSFGRRIVNH